MKRIFLFPALLLVQNCQILALAPNVKGYGMVTYERVLNFRGRATHAPFTLFFNPEFSVFYAKPEAKKADCTINVPTDDMLALPFDPTAPSRYIVRTELRRDNIQSQVTLFSGGRLKVYIVEEKITRIEWAIRDEFKTLHEFKVQKAVGRFRGRNYVAWFSNDIPVRYGPWKLNGLPGLILEVADETNEVAFRAVNIRIPADPASVPKVDFQFEPDANRITLAEYLRREKEQALELSSWLNARLPEGATVEISSIKISPNEILINIPEKELEFEFEK